MKPVEEDGVGWLTADNFLATLVELATIKFPNQDAYTAAVRLVVGHVLPFAERL